MKGWGWADMQRGTWRAGPVGLGLPRRNRSCAPDPEKRVLQEAEGQLGSGSVAETVRQEADRRSKEEHPMSRGCQCPGMSVS